ncbi:site-specific integrase [Cupriavidus taiwanensis]|uniref:site-specific integrase n=1 Tax=Cupriavidus taiwanensis TaxID=164546 RepID=UPI000E101C89|nr:site-specific integrase [Cupriavidus taiwanensis]SOY56798.1 Phage integrase [Cupriavidus taiwanensis]SOY90699.1 Phage integrase [Cupriavidus taiwanensis]SOZ63505.1 Phage integrase [Cupriavidus taiwanensis]SOZ82508.1 Phage integrase [Cupriavidus taiwanensis]SOZ84390.1 Phage integrase [Cupriavidus taiwanensis]
MGADKLTKREGIEVRDGARGTTIRIRFQFQGRECRETLKLEATTANLRYAERLRGEILNAIGRGTFSYADYFPDSKRAKLEGAPAKKATIGERLDDFMKEATLSVHRGAMSPSTLNGYRKIVDGLLKPKWGKTLITEAQPSALRSWIASMDVTAKTARNVISPLRSIFQDALNEDLIEQNPLDRIALDKILTKTKRKSTYEVDPFSLDEITAILAACDGPARNLFQFAFWAGLRTSELIGLRWKDVDFEAGLIHVRQAVVVKTEKTTKTDAGTRDVLMLPSARAALEAQKQWSALMPHGRVFTCPWNGKPWTGDKQIRVNCWTHILKKAEVRYRNPYQTRHTYASTLLSRGENPLWVAQQMGHVDTEMIIKHYGRWIPEHDAKAGYTPKNAWDEFSASSK